MTDFTYTYKGYRIKTRQMDHWVASLWPPGSDLARTEIAEATIGEGEAVCVERAKRMIDRWYVGKR